MGRYYYGDIEGKFWFARLLLGEKIHKCVKEIGSCAIEAEY